MRSLIIAIILIVAILGAVLVFKNKPAQAPTRQGSGNTQNNNPAPVSEYDNLPLSQARERVTKKPFGIKTDPKTSPVQPEKFSGYHAGTDYEILPGEDNADVAVHAICDGKLLQKRTATGYGGIIVQSCNLNSQEVTVVYGHIKLASVSKNIGESILQAEQLAILGKGYSAETDNERKHLHIGIHKGNTVNILGYVQSENELGNWLDFEELIKK